MSLPQIRAALETALDAMTPALATAWPNVAFTPPSGEPYQEAALLMADPSNDEYGAGAIKQGVLQVTLCYPFGQGSGDIDARAQAIETAFKRGNSFTSGSTTLTISRTANVMPGYRDGAYWRVPVQVRFHTYVAP